jgi:opacity protein-like surface antigen
MSKKITTICCAVALLATTATTPALSQSKNFAGPSIAVHAGLTSSDTNLNIRDDGEDALLNLKLGENDVAYGADIAYSFPIDNNFLISIGATYDFDKKKAGSISFSADGVSDLVSELSIEKHYSFYAEPTYAFNNSTALFAKLGYHKAKGSVSLNEDIFTKDIKGLGYGFGIKTFLNNNVFIKAEASLVKYDKETYESDDESSTTAEPETVSGLISIGYKF